MTALGHLETFAGGGSYVRTWGKSGRNPDRSGHRVSKVRLPHGSGSHLCMARTAAVSHKQTHAAPL
jgi:hypothetical protein